MNVSAHELKAKNSNTATIKADVYTACYIFIYAKHPTHSHLKQHIGCDNHSQHLTPKSSFCWTQIQIYDDNVSTTTNIFVLRC